MKAFPKDVKQKTNKKMQSTAYTYTILISSPVYRWLKGLSTYSCMFINIYLACTV